MTPKQAAPGELLRLAVQDALGGYGSLTEFCHTLLTVSELASSSGMPTWGEEIRRAANIIILLGKDPNNADA